MKMKVVVSIICLICMFAVSSMADIGWDSKGKITNEMINLKIKKEGWGSGNPADIGMLLSTVIRDFAVNFPSVKKQPIIVEHSPADNPSPRCLNDKTANGERVIWINSRDTYWCQYSYQFAHELCHAMCAAYYDSRPKTPAEAGSYSMGWLGESFSECASYYTMRKMAETWKTDPPYAGWKGYAPNLAGYVKDNIAGNHKVDMIPEGQTFAQWFKANEDVFQKDPVNRPKNSVVAEQFLPLFEKNPADWEIILYVPTGNSLSEILNKWYDAVPEKHKPVMKEVMKMFDVKINPAEQQKKEEKKP